jgi:hypothetical protein
LTPLGVPLKERRRRKAAVIQSSASEDFARELGAETDPAKRRAMLKRVELQAMGDAPAEAFTRAVHIVSAEEFAAVDEPGADAILGDSENALIAENSDAMVTGDGGAGKTTLTIDLACHLAAGDSWLGLPVRLPVRVLLVENEGPRPLFRKKLERKIAAWEGSTLQGRLSVFDEPWASFSFADENWRHALAVTLSEHEIDVLVAGPITRLGMDEAGTLQQVRDFMALVDDVRTQAGRRVAIVLVHHDNKAGNVSGAWEGAGDTLLHVEGHSPGITDLHIQKARWSADLHGQRYKLAWTDGEGYELKDERDYIADAERLLADGNPRTVKEIMKAIHARESTVKDTVSNPVFQRIDGKSLPGKSPKGVFYALHH